MGLFSNKNTQDVRPEFASVIVASTDKTKKMTLEALARSQEALDRLLEPGEVPICVAWYMGMMGGNMLLVVTNRRSLSLKKDAVKEQLRHEDVAGTTIAKMPNGDCLVQIESERARLDFNSQDSRRFEHIIQVQTGTPRVAQAICAAVDQHLVE